MYGRKVKLRFLFVVLILITLILTTFLVLKSLEENVVYFQSPSEIKALSELDKKKIRVGGMVKKNSISINSSELKFVITDFQNINFDKKIRVGGMVKKDSISINSSELKFVITDFKNEINVTYTGAIPNLFEEGKGVVAEGVLNDRNFFSASKILAKHDENYMPPEVKQAIGEK